MDVWHLISILLAISTISRNAHAVTSDVHQLLQNLNEFYIFKPVQHDRQNISNGSVNTSLSMRPNIHMKTTHITIFANNTIFDLELVLNEDFISSDFSTSYAKDDGTFGYRRQKINHCYYHGFLRGQNASQVVASTCNGLRGTMFLTNDILEFAPVDETNTIHVLHRPVSTSRHSCANPYFKSFHQAVTDYSKSHARLKRDLNEKKFIELLVVADNKEAKAFADRESLHNHVMEIVNHIDILYKKLDLRVVLLHIEVWDKEDKIESDTDPQNVLGKFLAYRKKQMQETSASSPWRYTDNAQLLYGGKFKGSTVGMATVSSMCGLRSGGVNEDGGNALRTAATVAHEMGHNLGMSHDTQKCNCGGKKCVMAATASFTFPEAWSDCSVDYLEQGYKYGTSNCLLNVPDSSRLFGGPKCGNGIVEQDEKCDCGLPDDCDSACCNATSCQLLPGADCDSGACCTSNCRFKASCSECRPTANDCDIAEYCSGHSAHCPGNIHKMDGMDCRSGDGVCYGGICRSHDMQCKEIWGPDAKNGNEQCYLSVNKKGDLNGNCGKSKGVYKKCTPENAVCGKLLCSDGEDFPLIASDRTFYRNNFADFVCKSLSSVNDSSDVGDSGLVWDGTKCAPGKMCFDGKCEEIQAIIKECSADCHGHGICNNFGNCHCDKGWAPPDCSKKGDGGSIDSGHICVNKTDMQVVLTLVFFLVIMPIILAIIFFVWWRYCGGKHKMYAWRKNRQYKKGNRNQRKVETGQKRRVVENTPVSRPAPPASAPRFSPTERNNGTQVTASANPIPRRPPPPSRPSPSLPTRGAPPPRSALPPPRPKPSLKPRPEVVYKSQPQKESADDASDQSISIQERIARLQRNNVV